MKNLLKTIALAICISTCYSCSVEPVDSIDSEQTVLEDTQTAADATEANSCTGQNPEVRITNNGTVPINLDVINEDDDVVGYVHNLLPGEASIWISFDPGQMLFSVSNDTFQDIKVVYMMDTCMIFDMEVDINNELTSAIPQQL